MEKREQHSTSQGFHNPLNVVTYPIIPTMTTQLLILSGTSLVESLSLLAENYRAWRRTFLNAIAGLDLTASEEIDLLVKWLGKESALHAERIRAVHINDPLRGLQMIWDRLDECYGAPEVVEAALFRCIDNFPKLSNKDYSKLRELSDLLMELESAKAEGDLPGLSYLDTARGVNPVVQKLPYSLQEKWLSVGSSYKQQYRVSFPPFVVFVDFISTQARIRNDPSFNLSGQADAHLKMDKTPWKTNRQREISVHKTDVSSEGQPDLDEHPKKIEDPKRQCPIHKRPHSLAKCRTFREKPLDERKAFLKENGICFKCCSSTSHMARTCKMSVTYSECQSEKHVSALYPGTPPWSKDQGPFPDHGGRLDNTFRGNSTLHASLWR